MRTSPSSFPFCARWRRGTPSQSRSAGFGSPQTDADAVAVVGRRRPTGESSSPASALNSDDLPAPVGPASATTVSSRPSPSRSPARSTTRRAEATPSASSRPSASSTARASASSRLSSSPLNARPGLREPRREAAPARPPEEPRRPRRRGIAVLEREQAFDALEQVVAGARRQGADGLVAEDRLEHLLARGRGAAGDDELRARHAAGVGEDGDHDRHAGTVDAQRRESRSRPLAHALLLDELEHVRLPGADGVVGALVELRRGGVEARPEQRSSGGVLAPRSAGALGRAIGRCQDDGIDARLDRRLDLALGRGLPDHEPAQAVAHPPDPRLEGAHDVPGPDHLVPAGQDLAAQERAAPDGVVDLLERAPVSPADVRPQLLRCRTLLGEGRLDHADARRNGVQRARQRSPHECLPPAGIGRQPVEPAADRSQLRGRDQTVVEQRFPDDEQLRVVEAALAEHVAEVRGDLAGRVGRYAVEDECDRRAALPRAAEQLPRHRVRVPRRRRDEQPGIRRREQLGAEGSVLRDDRVDVGRVEQRQPLGQPLGRSQPQLVGPGVAAGDAGERGEDAVVGEPADVVRVAHEHRAPRRRSQHARRRQLLADEAVHERRLARARRAADDHEQRRVHLAQPGKEVVVDLRRQLVPEMCRLLGRRQRQPQLERAQLVSQCRK